MKFPSFKRFLMVGTVSSILSPLTVAACPTIDGLVDYNCDQKIQIGVLGDSFVFGTGDKKTGSKGGYVGRLAKLPQFKNAQIIGMGLPGYSSFEILIEVKRSLASSRTNRLKRSLSDLDILVIDMGRNDFFQEISPSQTVTNLQTILKVIEQRVGHGAKIAPLFAVSRLALTSPSSRPLQRVFISKVDSTLKKKSSPSFPVRVGFDALNTSLLSKDGLHPSPSGYAQLATILDTFLLGAAQDTASETREDVDQDGVYDIAETKVFQTNPAAADSDGDGLSDGDEIFTVKTNPLLADTDGDSVSDGVEVTGGSNPLDASSVP